MKTAPDRPSARYTPHSQAVDQRKWRSPAGVLGLAAVAATSRLERVYARGGFRPAHPGSRVLLRPPHGDSALQAPV
jgi:hypothetical protein